MDATNQCNKKNVDAYVELLNNCKIRFRWFADKESKNGMTWRDLTGPEKIRLFRHIDIPAAFPDLQSKEKLQKLWKDFFNLMVSVGSRSCDATDFEQSIKAWVKLFTSVYQTKDVTPYMHVFAMHVPQFLEI